MSTVIAWMAAEAERPEIGTSPGFPRRTRRSEERPATQHSPAHQIRVQHVGAQQIPVAAVAEEIVELDSFQQRLRAEEDRERERRTYRGRTVAMLRRYMRYSIETDGCRRCWGGSFFGRR
jgi:hypothetical protein